MTLRNLAGVAVVAALLISGCGKDKSEETADAEFADIPSLEETSTKQTTDSSDIFDEFYEDEGTGTAQTEPVTEPEPVEQTYGSSSYVPEFADNGRYVVQVSCVASPELGSDVAQQLVARGYPAYVAEVQNPTPELMGTYHRVRIGSFHTVTAARNFGNNVLVPAGYEFWVDNKSNDNVGMDGYGLGAPAASGGYESSYQASTEPSAASTQSSSSWDQSTTTTSAATDQWSESGSSTSATDAESAGSDWGTGTTQDAGTAEQGTSSEQADDWGNTTTTTPSENTGTTQEQSGGAQSTEGAATGTDDGWGDEDWGDDW